MLRKILALLCIMCTITACKTNNNPQQNTEPVNREQELYDEYKMVEIFQYQEHEDDLNKIMLSMDDEYAYFVYYENQNTYRCLSIVREDIQSHEQSVLYDFSNENIVVHWLTVNDSVVYLCYSDSNLSYTVAKLDNELRVLDHDISEISKFYKADSKIYYVINTDSSIQVKCIQDSNVAICKKIDQADGTLPVNLGGTISNNRFIYSYNNDVYLFDGEIETYHLNYTVLNACVINDVLIANEYYIDQDQAKYRTHFFNITTQKDFQVADTQLSEIYTDEYDHLFYVGGGVKVLEVDNSENIISSQISEFDSKAKWTHFGNEYYQSCKNYNEYTIYSVQHK